MTIRFFTVLLSLILFYPTCFGETTEPYLTPLETGFGISPGVFLTSKTKGGELSFFRVPKSFPCDYCFWYYGLALGQNFQNHSRHAELEIGAGSFFGATYWTAGVRDDKETIHFTSSLGGQIGILPGYFFIRSYRSDYEWGYLFKIPIAVGSRRH
jgi:hypothetical protein